MAVLIRGPKSFGSCQRSCSARCYDAKHDKCVCICRGKNHGVGFRQANENTEGLKDEMTIKHGVVCASTTLYQSR